MVGERRIWIGTRSHCTRAKGSKNTYQVANLFRDTIRHTLSGRRFPSLDRCHVDTDIYVHKRARALPAHPPWYARPLRVDAHTQELQPLGVVQIRHLGLYARYLGRNHVVGVEDERLHP